MIRGTALNARFWVQLLIVGSSLAYIAVAPLLSDQRDISLTNGERNLNAVCDRLLPVIFSSGKPVRLYYRGGCPSTNFVAVPFPLVKVRPAPKNKTGLDAIREMFRDDGNVSVTEDSTGIIRIRIGVAPTAILETRLARLDLDSTARYNPDATFDAILDTKEIKAAEELLGFAQPIRLGGSRTLPDQRLPHLPAVLKNMTAEQVLDEVAKTWTGRIVVLYGACAEPEKPNRRRLYTMHWEGQR